MRQKSLVTLFLIILGCGVSLVLFFIPFIKVEQQNPGSTTYGFPINLDGDYYHYLYFLKSGLEGKINFENVYTDTPQPYQWLEPHYNLVGIIARPLGVSNVNLFNFLRIFSLCI